MIKTQKCLKTIGQMKAFILQFKAFASYLFIHEMPLYIQKKTRKKTTTLNLIYSHELPNIG